MTLKDVKLDFDPYELLGITHEAEEKEVLRAYRKKALKWHPDKNPDKKEFAEKMFHKLSKALEVLGDRATRTALDNLRKAREQARVRHSKLDAKRKKFKEELEAREAAAAGKVAQQAAEDAEREAQRKLEREIARLRKEGSELLQRERENIEREVHGQGHATARPTTSTTNARPEQRRLRVKWTPTDEMDYDKETLERIFQQHGRVEAVVMSAKKGKGSAIVEMGTTEAANRAKNYEMGFANCPLNVSCIDAKTQKGDEAKTDDAAPPNASSFPSFASAQPPTIDLTAESTTINDADFESVVLMRMRRAAERQRLIEQIQSEENDVDK